MLINSKKLNEDPTVRKATATFLKKIKDKGLFNNAYKNIYPSGSKPVTISGLPKTHKLLSKRFQDLSFRPVSSIATENYNLPKFLLELFNPFKTNEHCAKD